MAQQEKDILINIQVPLDKSIDNIAKLQKEIDKLIKSKENLDKQLNKEKISQEEYNKALVANKAASQNYREQIRLIAKDIEANIRQNDQYTESIRRGAEGYQSSILRMVSSNNSLVDSLLKSVLSQKEVQTALGGLSKAQRDFGDTIAGMGDKTKTAGGTFAALVPILKNALTSVVAFGRALVATPIGVIATAIGVLIVAFRGLMNVISGSEELTARWSKILAPLNRTIDFLTSSLQKLVGGFLSGIEALQKYIMGFDRLLEKLPLVGGFIKKVNDEVYKSIELEQQKYDLEKNARQQIVNNAQAQLQASQLRGKAADKEAHTAQERIKMLQEAARIEEENLKRELALKTQRVDLATAELNADKGNAQKQQQLADLTADQIRTQMQLDNAMAQNASQVKAIIQEEANQVQEASRRIVETKKEQARLELEARHQYEDTVTSMMEEGIERSRRETELAYNREIDSLKERLKTEENLTVAARKDINKTIELLEKKKGQDLDKLTQENVNKEAERIRKSLELRLEVIKSGTIEELNIKLALLAQQREAELLEAQKLGIDKQLVIDKYQKMENDLYLDNDRAARQQVAKEQELYWTGRMQQAQLNGESQTAVKIEQYKQERAQMVQLEDESDEQYLLRQQNMDNQIALAKKERLQEVAAMQAEQLGAVAGMFGAASSMLESFAEDNEALAAFSKAMALFEIGLNTAKAISAGVAAAQSVPFPGNLVAIVTTISAVMSNIAQANKLVSKQKQPKSGFAQGGLVSGAGSGTSDSIPAHLSHGESVLTARATELFSPILSSFNQIGGGVPIATQSASAQIYGEEMLTRAFAKALRSMPRPQVSVEEINNVDTRVHVLENKSFL